MAAKTGHISFADTTWFANQPNNATSTDAAHPTTSLDFRIDIDLDTLTTGRVFAGIHGLGASNAPWWISIEASNTVRLSHGGGLSGAGATQVNFAGNNWFVTGRMQYRITWSGTTATVYKRDPASFDLDLSDNTNWTQTDSQTVANVNTLVQAAGSPFVLMQRFSGVGWAAADLYELRYTVDGTLTLHVDGDTVTIDTAGNFFDDAVQGADEWSWEDSDDPTLVPPDVFDLYGFASETDTAMPFDAASNLLETYGFASESDDAMPFEAVAIPPVLASYGFASETDQAMPFVAVAALVPADPGSQPCRHRREFSRFNRCRCCNCGVESASASS